MAGVGRLTVKLCPREVKTRVLHHKQAAFRALQYYNHHSEEASFDLVAAWAWMDAQAWAAYLLLEALQQEALGLRLGLQWVDVVPCDG